MAQEAWKEGMSGRRTVPPEGLQRGRQRDGREICSSTPSRRMETVAAAFLICAGLGDSRQSKANNHQMQ